MELIFETDWEAMKRSNGFTCPLEVLVQLFRALQSLVEENLMQAIVLAVRLLSHEENRSDTSGPH